MKQVEEWEWLGEMMGSGQAISIHYLRNYIGGLSFPLPDLILLRMLVKEIHN